MNRKSKDFIPYHVTFIAWINIATQISFPLVSVFAPVAANAFTEQNHQQRTFLLPKKNTLTLRETQPYTLQAGETTQSIAKKYNISLEQLRKLNQFRTFSQSFETLKAGDELDIPMSPLPTLEWENEKPVYIPPEASSEEEIKLAQFVSKAGQFFTKQPNHHKTKAFTQEIITTTASSYLQDWFNHFGSSQIKLVADKKFSLKNSQIDLLLPIYENEESLFFTQGSFHRQEQRIETNLGFGARWYGENQMVGGNTFFDYDISRGHSRLGLGVEYRRDFLKLSGNSYHRLSSWRNARELTDHSARPSNGWDLRAEGWLPTYPHIGGKLTYEQYYGDDVALFGTKNLQRDPYSINIGLNYTPVPLITFNAEHRQGKASKKDSRIGLQLNYQFGKSLKQHLDPESVNAFRSLMGNRYDFVSRNNHIVLDYKKNDVIHLNITDSITGYAGEKIPLHFTVTSKYGLSHIKWDAQALVAAGGHILNENGQYSLVLPSYKNIKNANNYAITAIAIDKKGNTSSKAIVRVSVTQPAIHTLKSVVSSSRIDLIANGKSSQKLSLSIKDKAGNVIDLAAKEITLERATTRKVKRAMPAKGLKAAPPAKYTAISPFTRLAAGQYEATLTAGTKPESFILVPKARNAVFPEIKVTVVADTATIQATKPTPNTQTPQLANGNSPIEVKTQLKDANGNPIINSVVTWSSNKDPQKVIFTPVSSTTDNNGYATTLIASTLAGEVTITATPTNGSPQDVTLTFIPDATTSVLKPQNINITQNGSIADGKKPNLVSITITDQFGNPLPNVDVQFATDKGTLANTLVKTDANGVAQTAITSTQAGEANVTITVDGKDIQHKVQFVGDKSTPQIAKPTVSQITQIADGKKPIEITTKLVDAHNNPLPNTVVTWSSNKNANDVQFTQQTTTTDANGLATTTITSTVTGDIIITATAPNATPQEVKVDFLPDTTTAAVQSNDIHVSQTSTVANSNSANTISITVTDAKGNPVPNVEVAFATDKGTLADSKVTTNSQGVAQTAISSDKAGDATVTITVDGKDVKQTISFVGDKNTPQVVKPTTNTVPQIANGNKPFEVKTQIVDANNNPLPNTVVNWTSNKNGNEVSFSEISSITDANGFATTQVTSTVSGDVLITAATPNATSQDISLTFLPDSTTATIKPTDIIVGSMTSVANGVTGNPIAITVTDANGNVVPNVEVQFATNNGSLADQKVMTDNQGVAKTTITSKQAGDAKITVTVGGKSFDKTVVFTANIQTAKVSSVIPEVKNQYLADGKMTVTYTAKIVDANNNPISNVDTDWLSNLSASEVKFSQAKTKTNAQGETTTTITSTKAEMVIVTASTNGDGKMAKEIHFVADKAQAQITSLNVKKSTIVANGVDKTDVYVFVEDNYGNPVEGVDVQLQTNNGAQLTVITPFSKTDSHGLVRATLSTSQAANNIMVAAVLANGNQQPISSTVKAVADNTTATVTIASSANQVQIRPQAQKVLLTATVVDNLNNPLVETPVTWLSDNNTLSVNTTRTDNRGQVTVELSGYIAGETTVTAQLLNRREAQEKIQFIAGDANSLNSFFEIKPQTIVANNREQATATLTLRDQWNNPVTGQRIDWDSNNNAITFTDSKELANTGEYQVKVSGNLADTIDITAKNGAVSKQKSLGLIADSATALIKDMNITSQATVPADGISRITVQATITDATNNLAPAGIAIGWRSDVGELSQPVSHTDNNGIAQITLTSTQAGKGSVTAILGQNTKQTVQNIEFLAGNVSSSASTVALSTPSLTAATGETEITVTLKDDIGNRLGNLANKITLDYSTDLGLANSPTFTEVTPVGTYRAKLHSTKAGNTDITVLVDGVTLNQKAPLTVIADAQSAQVRGDIKVSKTTETVGNQVTISAQFEDANGNQLGAGIPVFWTANDGSQLSDNQTTTDANGRSEVTVQRSDVGYANITVNLTSQNTKTAPTISFTQGTIDTSKTVFNITPTTIVAGQPATVELILKDQFGNLLTNQISAIQISSNNNEVRIAPVTMPSAGVYHAVVSSDKTGAAILSANLNGSALSQTLTLNVTSDKATSVITSLDTSTNNIQAGNAQGVVYTAKIVDKFNNPVPQVNVSWHLQGKAEPFPHSSITDINGNTKISVTSHTVGALVMTAALSASEDKKASVVNVLAGTVNITNSTFTTTKTDIGPDGLESTLFTVKLQDDFGNALLNETVDITSNVPAQDFTISPVTNHQDGSYSATATATKQGTAKVTAKVGNQTIANPIEIKVDAINPTLRFDNMQQRLTYSSAVNNGQVVKGLPNGAQPVWSSDNTSIATVDQQGKVKLKKAGRTKIWARIDGNGIYKSAAASYEVDVEKAKPNLTLTSADTISTIWSDNQAHNIQTSFGNTDVTTIPLEYVSQNTNIAQIDSVSGAITQVKPGVAKLTVRSKETDQFVSESQDITYNLAKARFNVNFNQKEQEITDQRNLFNLQQTSVAIPPKADIEWNSGANNVVSIAKNGSIQSLGKGEANLTMTVKANDYFEQSSGDYKVKVYTKPAITINSISYGNNGNQETNSAYWSPVYTDDNLTVNWSVAGTSDFDMPSDVKIVITKPDGGTDSATSSVTSGPRSNTYEPKQSYLKTNQKVKVEIIAIGKSQHKIENRIQAVDVPIVITEPKDIGNLSISYRTFAYIVGDDVVDNANRCNPITSISWFNNHRKAIIFPKVQIGLSGKQLLENIQVSHQILKSEYSGNESFGSNRITYPTLTKPTNGLDTYEYSYSQISNQPIKDECYMNHNGSGKLTTILEFAGLQSELKTPFYWSGY
ncbi:LysM peptidoglycan-binding domain-containing protein [Providencia sp. wls1922]|nr:Ig-like domain-containing protein [Providencia sp. wls1922]MTC47244.1 LysM peptidoglycan-binding domain-containing protein [Providencia sp. wls1922]